MSGASNTGARRPLRLRLRVLQVWTAVTMLFIWLPLVRGATDGRAYRWALMPGVGGRGTGGDYWVLVLLAGFAGFLLYAGWRGGWRGSRWWFYGPLLLWHWLLAAGMVVVAVLLGDELRLRGDTLGIDVPFGWIGALIFGGFAVLALVAALGDRRAAERAAEGTAERAAVETAKGAAQGTTSGAGRAGSGAAAIGSARQRAWLAACVAALPVQLVLLRFGPQHGLTDQLGVLLTIAQWLVLYTAVFPWRAGAAATQGRWTSSAPRLRDGK